MLILDEAEHPLIAFYRVFSWSTQLSQLPDPCNVREAMAALDADEGKEAVDRKMEHLNSYDVYELVPRMKGMRTLKLGCVLHRKFKIVLFERNKGRLVARGSYRRPGIDYGEFFSPVVHLESLRTILALVAVRDLDIIQFDITSVYLHGTLKEGVFME